MQEGTKQKQAFKQCDVCGLPIKPEKAASITSWLFRDARCRCAASAPSIGADFKPTSQAALAAQISKLSENFELIDEIGSGGMGTVYKVKDTKKNRTVALKVLRPELCTDTMAVRRFQQEINTARSFYHPNLASIYEFGLTEEGSPYFVMELVAGESLADVLLREGKIDAFRAIDIFSQVCEALAYAHDNDVVHRDLKPSNILLHKTKDKGEVVKLVDFGVAKMMPSPGKDAATMTKTGEIFGSPTYMSPEQCQGANVDARSDIYSLGCSMYEALSGSPPFVSEQPVKTLLSHIYDTPAPLNRAPDGATDKQHRIEFELATIVMACLQKSPYKRYQSALALQQDLELLLKGEKPAVLAKKESKEKFARVARRIQFHAAWALPVVLLFACIAGIFFTGSSLGTMMDTVVRLEAPQTKEQEKTRSAGAPNMFDASDEYDKPYLLQYAAERASKHGDLHKSSGLYQMAIMGLVRRKDFNAAVAPYAELARQLAVDRKMTDARIFARYAAEALLRSATEPAKGVRFAKWFYVDLYPARLETHKISALLQEVGDLAAARSITNFLYNSVLSHADRYASLKRGCLAAYTSNATFAGNTALGAAVYGSLMDRQAPISESPFQTFTRYICDKVEISCDLFQTYFGDETHLPAEFLNEDFTQSAIVLGDIKNAEIFAANNEEPSRYLLHGTCLALQQKKGADLDFDTHVQRLHDHVAWSEEKFAIRLFVNHQDKTVDSLYQGLISACQKRGSEYDFQRADYMEKYARFLTGENRFDEADKLREQAIALMKKLAYNAAIRSILINAACDYLCEKQFAPASQIYKLVLDHDTARPDMKQMVGYDQLDVMSVTALALQAGKLRTLPRYEYSLNVDVAQGAFVTTFFANFRLIKNRADLAMPLYDKFPELHKVNTGQPDIDLLLLTNAAEIAVKAGQAENAKAYLRDAETASVNASRLAQAKYAHAVASITKQLGDPQAAADLERKAQAFDKRICPRELYNYKANNLPWQVHTGRVDVDQPWR